MDSRLRATLILKSYKRCTFAWRLGTFHLWLSRVGGVRPRPLPNLQAQRCLSRL
jgi:hypothetical protein